MKSESLAGGLCVFVKDYIGPRGHWKALSRGVT